jgi:hypothetical protein
MDSGPLDRPPKPPFDRERFVFKILAVVIGTQLLIYSLAAGVCGQRALEGRPVGQICPGTLEQLQGGFDSTLKLLLALLGGWHLPLEHDQAPALTAKVAKPAKQSAGCCQCSPA